MRGTVSKGELPLGKGETFLHFSSLHPDAVEDRIWAH
jgi:hypothetical protein